MGKRRTDPKKFAKTVGLKIRQMRNERAWTLEQCEEHGFTNWRHLQAIESGRPMTLTTLVNVANLFGVTPYELLKD